MKGWAAIRLVATREITQRARERSFLISSAVTLVIILLAAVLPGLLGFGDPARSVVAVVDDQGEAVVRAASANDEPFGVEVEARRLAPEAAERALAAEEVDAVLAGGALRAPEEPDDALVDALQVANREVRAAAALERAGVRGDELREVLAPPPLRVAAAEGAEEEDEGAAGIAFLAVLVLFGQLIGYGVYLAQGVVEEKSSRVVEVVLATIRPRELLAGKVLGLGALGLAQLLVVAVLGLLAAGATGAVDLDGDLLAAAGLAVVWFVVGYLFYATLFATAGALVPRQEELQSTLTPLTFVLLVSYFVAFTAVNDPESSLARIAGFIPFTAPMTMPPLIVQGAASPFEIAAALVITVGAALALVPLAGRIYSGAVLRTGSAVKLRDAWRSARTATR